MWGNRYDYISRPTFQMSNSNFSKLDSKYSMNTGGFRKVPVDSRSLASAYTHQSEYRSVYFDSKTDISQFCHSRPTPGFYNTSQPCSKVSILKNRFCNLPLIKKMTRRFIKTSEPLPTRRVEKVANKKLDRLHILFPQASRELLEKSLILHKATNSVQFSGV
eukprot:NODE_276_length_10970_cov_0.627909.p9 type:complete len:162 gc:universal NODE_276_length_10970_cov_0.627909:3573-3088(-)